MSDLQDHIVSIWDGECNKGNAKGSGFCISPMLVLTAFHVIENLDLEKIHIGLVAGTDSGRRVEKIHFIEGYDAAILKLYLSHKKPQIDCQLQSNILKGGLSVELIAYHVDEKSPKGPIETEISNHCKDDQHWLFSNYPAKGMSGGAVLHNGKVIGIIKSRDQDNNNGLLIPLHLFADQINKHLNSDDNRDDSRDDNTQNQINSLEVLENKNFKKERRKDLLKHLEQLKTDKNTEVLYQLLINKYLKESTNESANKADELLEELVTQLNTNSVEFVRKLRIACQGYMQSHSNDMEILLLLLLSQLNKQEQGKSNSIYELSVRTHLLVELKMASCLNVPVDLHKHEKLGLIGKYALDDKLATIEQGIDAEDYAKQYAKTIAYRLYKKFDDAKNVEIDNVDKYDWQALNERIISLRDEDFRESHRFEVNVRQKSSGAMLSDPEVCSELLQLLPDLPIIHFGKGMEKDEISLNTQVDLFYEKLKQDKQKE